MTDIERNKIIVIFLFILIFLLPLIGLSYFCEKSYEEKIEQNDNYQYIIKWISDASMRVDDFEVLNYTKGRSEFREINTIIVKDNIKNKEIKIFFKKSIFSFSQNNEVLFDSKWLEREWQVGTSYHLYKLMMPLFEQMTNKAKTRDINLNVPTEAEVDATIRHKNTVLDLKNL